jgi:PAS domain S-box-containing protein
MSNLIEYDHALARFNRGLKIISNPLFSWDFYYNNLIKIRLDESDFKNLNLIALQAKWGSQEWGIRESLQDQVVVVTDAKLTIVFASNNIVEMNGYKATDVIGKNPKMFQGVNTCDVTSNEIRLAIEKQVPFEKKVLNYKKNGDPYYCLIKGYPVFNTKGDLAHFIAFERAA